jgi:hypothetical protein
MDQNRALLFSDWDLGLLVQNINTEQEGDISSLVSLVQHGKYEEASDWLKIETSQYPWILLVSALVSVKNGNLEEARRLLRAITLISKESIVQLWAWHNLRLLERNPSSSLAQQVLGVVIEVPYENGEDILASYADGTSRYINHSGGMIVWEDFDETITPLIYEGLKLAHPLGDRIDKHKDDPIQEGDVRLTVLTPGGMTIWEGSPEEGSDVSRLFAQQANLLRALVRMALTRHNNSG